MIDEDAILYAYRVLTEGSASEDLPKKRKAAAEKARKKARPWLEAETVRGIGYGRRSKGNQQTDEWALKLLVVRKEPGGPGLELAPREVRIPGLDEPVPVDVEEVGEPKLQDGGNAVAPGAWIKTEGGNPGTLGCLVFRQGQNPGLFILGAAHVLAYLGSRPVLSGEPVHHSDETGRELKELGVLSDFKRIEFDADMPNKLDGALVRTSPELVSPFIGRPDLPVGTDKAITLGEAVYIYGARSRPQPRRAFVKKPRAALRFSWGSEIAHFSDLIACDRVTEGGDSGAPVLDARGKLIGLVLGSDDAHSYAWRIGHGLRFFGVELVTAKNESVLGQLRPFKPPSLELEVGEELIDQVVEIFPSVTPRRNIAKFAPDVITALRNESLDDGQMLSMALATIRAETEGFEPISEGVHKYNTSGKTHDFDLYDRHPNLGNQGPPDGERYRGRGFIQLTGRYNYRTIGKRIGLGNQLIDNPERANEPTVAAQILAAFLKRSEAPIRDALSARDFARARKAVNGGTHRLNEFTETYLLAEGRFA